MSMSSSQLSDSCLCVVDSIYADLCSHREPIVLPGSVYLRSRYRFALRKGKNRFNQHQQFQGFFVPPSDSNLKKWFKLPFPWSHKVPILFHLIFTGERGDNTFMELQTPRYKPQDIGASSCLEIIGKLVSQFKGRHTTAHKRSILGVMT